jgi:hypothetical protein
MPRGQPSITTNGEQQIRYVTNTQLFDDNTRHYLAADHPSLLHFSVDLRHAVKRQNDEPGSFSSLLTVQDTPWSKTMADMAVQKLVAA